MSRIEYLKYTGLSGIAFLPLLVLFLRDMDDAATAFNLIRPGAVFLAYLCIFTLLYGLLDKKYRRLFIAISLSMIVFSAINSAYLLQTRFQISYEAISSVYETNTQELSEFISSDFLIRCSIISIAIVSISVLFYRVPKSLGALIGNASVGILPIWITAIISVITLVIINKTYGLEEYYPVREILMNKKYVAEVFNVVKRYRQLNYSFNGKVDEEKISNIILVIGS